LSIFPLLAVPVRPRAVSISAVLSKRFANAACATGGRVEVVVAVVVVVVVVVDQEGLLWLFPPHAATNIPMAAMAAAAADWRMFAFPGSR